MNRPESAEVHRFRDTVTVSFFGCEDGTTYLDPGSALALADALRAAAEDCIRQPRFASSTIGTLRVEVPPKPKKADG